MQVLGEELWLSKTSPGQPLKREALSCASTSALIIPRREKPKEVSRHFRQEPATLCWKQFPAPSCGCLCLAAFLPIKHMTAHWLIAGKWGPEEIYFKRTCSKIVKRRELARSGISTQGWGLGTKPHWQGFFWLLKNQAQGPTIKDSGNSGVGFRRSWIWSPPLWAEASVSTHLSFPLPFKIPFLSEMPRNRDGRTEVSRITSYCALQPPGVPSPKLDTSYLHLQTNQTQSTLHHVSKHSLITINQQAGCATAQPWDRLVNDGRRLPNGQLSSGWWGVSLVQTEEAKALVTSCLA